MRGTRHPRDAGCLFFSPDGRYAGTLAVIDPLDHRTTFGYDDADRSVTSEDAEGHLRRAGTGAGASDNPFTFAGRVGYFAEPALGLYYT